MVEVRCECGETARVPMGPAWQCSVCGRSWDLEYVSESEYQQFRSTARQLKWALIAGIVTVSGGFAALVLTLGSRGIPAGLFLAVIWYVLFVPKLQKRLRALYASVPQWQVPLQRDDG